MVCSRRADDILFDHNASHVIGSVVKTLTSHVNSLSQPGDLNVWNVVEIDPRHSQPSQVLFGRETIRDLAAHDCIVRLQSPWNESHKTTGLLLKLVKSLQVFDAMSQRLP